MKRDGNSIEELNSLCSESEMIYNEASKKLHKYYRTFFNVKNYSNLPRIVKYLYL